MGIRHERVQLHVHYACHRHLLGVVVGVVGQEPGVKSDVQELPGKVPAKRRQVEQLLDLHIAMWLASDELTPSERRRLEAEKERRKTLVKETNVLLLVGREGMTPQQKRAARELAASTMAVVRRGCDQELVKWAHQVFATPKETREPIRKETGVWAMIRYAKHRKIPVMVILPDGTISGDA